MAILSRFSCGTSGRRNFGNDRFFFPVRPIQTPFRRASRGVFQRFRSASGVMSPARIAYAARTRATSSTSSPNSSASTSSNVAAASSAKSMTLWAGVFTSTTRSEAMPSLATISCRSIESASGGSVAPVSIAPTTPPFPWTMTFARLGAVHGGVDFGDFLAGDPFEQIELAEQEVADGKDRLGYEIPEPTGEGRADLPPFD